jgi:hypothetical protein
VIDNTEIGKNGKQAPEEVDVRNITSHRVKKGKLEYLTMYQDNTTS